MESRCPTRPELGRVWGWMVQLYSVRSRASCEVGDFADLAELARWSGAQGADFILCNPLHAVAPTVPQEPSPYYPSSRRYLNPLYLRVPGVEASHGELIDRDAAFAAKDAALRDRYPGWDGQMTDFAVWCALATRHGPDYRDWPAELRHPRNAAVARARAGLADEVGYHCWLQQECAAQLASAQRAATEAGMRIGLIHDLAVGFDPGGADAWALQDDLAPGVTVGAPPDAFNAAGQDWQVPAVVPDRCVGPFRDVVRAALRHGGGLRLDHATGLFRLWWIPDGAAPTEGHYERYPAEALLGVLAEETTRAGAIAVAEDLGTVEAGVSETLREWGLLTSSVYWFAKDYPEQAMASVTTHDLPVAAGRWAEHEHVAATPSRLFAIGLADAVGEVRQQNQPGTTDSYPNWRLPLADGDGRPVLLEDLAGHPGVRRMVELARRLRPSR